MCQGFRDRAPHRLRENSFFRIEADTARMRERYELLRRFVRDDRAATAIEYCLIAGTVVTAIVFGVTAIGTKLNHFLVQVAVN